MTHRLLALAATAALAGGAADAATYTIDPNHTSAMFEIAHLDTSTLRGRFDQKEGTVEFDRAAKTGKVTITLQVASVSTGVPALDAKMRSEDFFDAAKYPTATFVGDRFAFEGDKVASVSGSLTMHGKTAPLTLKAASFNCYPSPQFKREVCGGNFTAMMTRTQWGIDFGLKYGFADTIPLVISVEAIAAQ